MVSQRLLVMAVPSLNGSRLVTTEKNEPRKVPASDLFAQLLKRKARTVVSDITECPPDTLPAHLSRLDDLRDIFGHLLRHDYRETREALASGVQLSHPHTLADWLEVLELTRRTHRAPAFVNSRDDQFAEIMRGVNTIAGLIASHPQAVAMFTNQEVEG